VSSADTVSIFELLGIVFYAEVSPIRTVMFNGDSEVKSHMLETNVVVRSSSRRRSHRQRYSK
jgi:hypothetical protein